MAPTCGIPSDSGQRPRLGLTTCQEFALFMQDLFIGADDALALCFGRFKAVELGRSLTSARAAAPS